MSGWLRAPLDALPPAVHGGAPPASGLLDFSGNGHPLGPSPLALAALRASDPGEFPDPQGRRLRGAVGARHGLPPGAVAVGAGAAELIWRIAAAVLAPGDRAVVLTPAFDEHRRAVLATGAALVAVAGPLRGDVALPLEALAAAARRSRARLGILCSPANPTGAIAHPAALRRLAASVPETLWLADEVYAPLSPVAELDGPEADRLLFGLPNLLRLRSSTKELGLPGLRVGYVLGDPPLATALQNAGPAWPVSGPATAAVLAGMGDAPHRAAGRAAVAEALAELGDQLGGLGSRPLPSRANFCLVPVCAAGPVADHLLGQGVLVRDATSFGLPGHVRVAARPAADRARLLQAWARVPVALRVPPPAAAVPAGRR